MSNRKEIINKVARKANVSKRSAAMYLEIVLEVIQLILARTGEVKLPGFGSFRAKALPERKGINPLTGKKTTFAPGVRVSFKPGKPLKETVENGSFIKGKARKKTSKPRR